MAYYNSLVEEHFTHPRNVGTMPDADGVGTAGNLDCGDLIKIFIKVKDNHIADIKFQTVGCGAAIASSSMTSEMAKGKTLEEALAITKQGVADALGGLPPRKMYCSNLAAEALHQAIQEYIKRQRLVEESSH